MASLKGKKVLLISSPYRGYYQDIIQETERQGAVVTLFISDPQTLGYYNFLGSRYNQNVFLKKYYTKQENNLQTAIIQAAKDKEFDYILVISLYPLTTDFLRTLFENHSEAKKILYMWDSIKSFHKIDSIKLFDRIFSFDFKDCDTYSFIHYLCLFYEDAYSRLNVQNYNDYKWDVFFLGVRHTIRQDIISEMIDYFLNQNITYNIKLVAGFRNKVRSFFTKDKYTFLIKPLAFDQFKDEYRASKVIIDISSPEQTGLPFRIIEAVAAHKKIITTNNNIVRETFYNPSNVFIWGTDDLNRLKAFISSPMVDIDTSHYTIHAFINQLFS